MLRAHGRDPDYDPIYFRYLLRIGGVEGDGSLYHKFESLLGDMGIRIEFDEDEAAPDVTRELENMPQSSPCRTTPNRSRRASFSSFYDAGDEDTERFERRTQSLSPLSRKQASLSEFSILLPSTRPPTRASERTMSIDRLGFQRDSSGLRSGARTRRAGHNIQIRGRSLSSRQSPVRRRRSISKDSNEDGRRGRRMLQDVASQQEPVLQAEPDDCSLGHAQLFSRPSDTQLSNDADTLYYHHLANVMRHCIRTWHDRASSESSQHHEMDVIATTHDGGTLLRQAFETWHSHLLERRQSQETARFFAVLERRAEKARTLYLLTKAFTHWAQAASDEVQRTCVARRHILRTKYFNAWRDITAVNELKVRRHGTSKFFFRWRLRYLNGVQDHSQAVEVRQKNLVKTSYWIWFWAFCERRAPGWYEGRLKRTFLTKWIDAVRERREREGWIEGVYRRDLFEKYLERWKLQIRSTMEREQAAMRSREAKLVRGALASLQLHARLAPIGHQVSRMVDWRIAHGALQTLVDRMLSERQAAAVNRARLLRNAWTTWNDRLRSQSLAARIDERVVLQTLYKWVLAERQALMRRIIDQRLQEQAMSRLVEKWRLLQARLSHRENLVRQGRNQRMAAKVVGRWQLQLLLARKRQQLAFEFHAPRAAQDTLQLWRWRLQHVRQLDRDASRAEFYFLATRTLRSWQTAVVESKKHKRKAAYAEMRRKVKMNMARKLLSTWRVRTAHRTEMTRRADDVSKNRLVVVSMNVFDSWRARRDDVVEMAAQANAVYTRHLAQVHLDTWIDRLDHHRQQLSHASVRADMRTLSLAATLLRRLGILAFAHATRLRSAEGLRARNDRKHARNMLRYWHERSLHRRSLPDRDPAEGEQHHEDFAGAATRRAEEWTAFDDSLVDWKPSVEALASATPVPGYLSTPGKRAARAKALVRLSTTPGGSPRVTPFGQRLRKGLSPQNEASVRRIEGRRGVFGRTVDSSEKVSRDDGGDGMMG